MVIKNYRLPRRDRALRVDKLNLTTARSGNNVAGLVGLAVARFSHTGKGLCGCAVDPI